MTALFTRYTVDGRVIEQLPRPAIAAAYDLEPHPEGGWYRSTWTSPESLTTSDGRTRPAATLILFCLPPGEASAWHLVASDEVWIWSGRGGIEIQLGGSDGEPVEDEIITLGPNFGAGQVLQARVPAGCWQRTLPSDQTGLASCLVSPGFSFDDFTLASDDS